jgi:hypothetical protein
MKKLLAILCLSILCLPLLTCDPDPPNQSPVPNSDWAVLIYASGNSSGDNDYTIRSIQDLEKVGSSDKVQVIAMISSPQTNYNARYYHIEHFPVEIGDNISSPVVMEKGGVDMSGPLTLRDFLNYAIANYPATHYALVISGYARGWPGACYDEHWGSGNHLMALTDLANSLEQVISASGIGKFDLVFFNTSSMATAEAAYELRNSADYMVASELNDMIYDLPCGANWLNTLVSTSGISSQELAVDIANAVFDTAFSIPVRRQISAIDIGKVGQLTSAVGNLGDALSGSNDISWDRVFECWREAYWTSQSETGLIDLRQFAYEIEIKPAFQGIPSLVNAADSLLIAIDNTIIVSMDNIITIPERNLGGLTIYMPYQAGDFDSTNYALIDFHNCGWNSLISRFISSIGENPGYELIVSVEPSNSGSCIAEPFRDHYQSGDTVMLSATPNGDYHFASWLIGGEHDYHKQTRIVFENSDIDVTVNFALPPSDSTVIINGMVSWPGHNLSQYTYVVAETLVGFIPYPIGQAHVNQFDGSYTMIIENFRSPQQVTFEAQDDVNNSGLWDVLDAGDGWWFYDLNGDGIRNDLISLSPGQSIDSIDIVLREYTPKR